MFVGGGDDYCRLLVSSFLQEKKWFPLASLASATVAEPSVSSDNARPVRVLKSAHPYMQADTPARPHAVTRVHIYAHASRNTHTHTRTHTHTHTHVRPRAAAGNRTRKPSPLSWMRFKSEGRKRCSPRTLTPSRGESRKILAGRTGELGSLGVLV